MATFAKTTFAHAVYAAARPSYPASLYRWILTYHHGRRDTCVDLGCGHGLVSRALSPNFTKLYGVDPSAGMLEQARATTDEKNIEFVQSPAESLSFLTDHSVDLVVSAQAVHWFDQPKFFQELKRIMRPGGTLALWAYGDAKYVDYPKASAIVRHCSCSDDKDTLGPYWPQPGRSIVKDRLHAIEPPMEDWSDLQRLEYEPGVEGPGSGKGTKYMDKEVTLGQSLEYLRTMSSFHGWQEAHPDRQRRSEGGCGDVVDEIFDKMVAAEETWQEAQSVLDMKVVMEWDTGLILARKS